MDRTIHKKLTAKHVNGEGHSAYRFDNELVFGHPHDIRILEAAAGELLQPRPQAIATLLQLAKEM